MLQEVTWFRRTRDIKLRPRMCSYPTQAAGCKRVMYSPPRTPYPGRRVTTPWALRRGLAVAQVPPAREHLQRRMDTAAATGHLITKLEKMAHRETRVTHAVAR